MSNALRCCSQISVPGNQWMSKRARHCFYVKAEGILPLKVYLKLLEKCCLDMDQKIQGGINTS